MASLGLLTDGESITYPAAAAGNGMAVAMLIKKPTTAPSGQYVSFGVRLTAGGAGIFALFFYGSANGSNSQLTWNGSTNTFDTTNDTPLNNKTTLVMVGYEDNGSTIDVYARWKDTDGTGASKSWTGRTRPSWPPASGEVFLNTDVADMLIDELMVFNEKYSTALFDALYAELLT